ncbi:MAG TPA: hypothetical protein IAB87_04475 [Candidatus Coprenecus merdipullorum]|nr:hypothetical protein [Candidatus Coprenecus merdipullorum]
MRIFEEEIYSFLSASGGSVERRCISAPGPSVFVYRNESGCVLGIVTVPLMFFAEGGTVESLLALKEELWMEGVRDRLLLYEDRWVGSGPLVRSMLQARMGLGRRVYARNCEVRPVNAETAAAFLERTHAYGSARSFCRLGLFRMRATGREEATMDSTPGMVALASFSSGRKMNDGRLSYEWIRYASLRGVRVVGGMGKLLGAFAAGIMGNMPETPFEVMTYSDEEWYDGRSYAELGFDEDGKRLPVAFLCTPDGSMRIHENKLLTDRKFRYSTKDCVQTGAMVRIFNPGSRRYVRLFGCQPVL